MHETTTSKVIVAIDNRGLQNFGRRWVSTYGEHLNRVLHGKMRIHGVWVFHLEEGGDFHHLRVLVRGTYTIAKFCQVTVM